KGTIVLAEVSDDELLQRAGAVRAIIAVDREGDDVPAEGGAHQVGRHLALAERAIGEIVERGLALRRFVDGERLGAIQAAHLGQVGVVGTVGHQPARLDPPIAQEASLRLTRKLSSRLRHRSMMPVQPGANAAVVVDWAAAHRAGWTPGAAYAGCV